MALLTRRQLFQSALATAAGNTLLPGAKPKRAVTDWVPLGNSGVKVTRLALGTGTFGGRTQRELGQEQFTRLVRHAYDNGIRFFETADNYAEMQRMLGIALKGLPRDSYRLMSKFKWREADNPQATIDRQRRELQTEYFDIFLLHNVRTPKWPTELERLRDAFSEAKHRKVLLSHGASCHGILPLRAFPGNKWLDVGLMRVNHNGTRMDRVDDDPQKPGDVPEVISNIKKVHAQGTGVIGMKIIGEGRFKTPEERDASIKFVTQLGAVDTVTIGFKNTAEIDEAIARINKHLNT